jgi:hypothetical protein
MRLTSVYQAIRLMAVVVFLCSRLGHRGNASRTCSDVTKVAKSPEGMLRRTACSWRAVWRLDVAADRLTSTRCFRRRRHTPRPDSPWHCDVCTHDDVTIDVTTSQHVGHRPELSRQMCATFTEKFHKSHRHREKHRVDRRVCHQGDLDCKLWTTLEILKWIRTLWTFTWFHSTKCFKPLGASGSKTEALLLLIETLPLFYYEFKNSVVTTAQFLLFIVHVMFI